MFDVPPKSADAEKRYTAPLPVLGQNTVSLTEPNLRPLAATAAEYLAAICVGLCALVPVVSISMYFGDTNRHAATSLYSSFSETVLAPMGLAAASLVLLINLHRRRPFAWWCQLILALLGVLSFPIGTLIYGALLIGWFQHSTQTWYGISLRGDG